MVKEQKDKEKTKRKLAHPKLPMQGQLNLLHEGTHFDLRPMFDDLNKRYFRGRLRNYNVMWGRQRKHRPKEYFIFGTIQEQDRGYSNQSGAGPAICAVLVSAIRALSRDAALE